MSEVTQTLFNCPDASVREAAGAWAPQLNIYNHHDGEVVVVAVQGTGGSAQVDIGPAEARDLAKALTDWADQPKAAA